jgi:hypothetical protein
MKKIIAVTALYIFSFSGLYAQENDIYDTINNLTTQHLYTEVIDLYKKNQSEIYSLKNDSLLWTKFRVSRAYFNVGDISTAAELINTAIKDSNAVSSKDLQLRLRLFNAHILSNQNKYQESIEEFDRIELLLQALISQNKAIDNVLEVNYAKEKLTTNYINKANNYYYLGDLEQYHYFTKLAYDLSDQVRFTQNTETANNAFRQHLIASRNLIEYYEITEHWDTVISMLTEYEAKLIEIKTSETEIVPDIEKEISRYKLRRAVYLKSKQNKYHQALTLIEEVLTDINRSENYDIFEDAVYQKINILFTLKEYKNLEEFFTALHANPLVKRNPNSLALLTARELQYYIIKDKPHPAQLAQKKLQMLNLENVNTKVQSAVIHTLIMYHTSTNNDYTARLLLENIIKQNLQKEFNATSQNIEATLVLLYQKYKYENEEPRSFNEVLTIILKDYKDNQVQEWVFKSNSRTLIAMLVKAIMILPVCIGIWYFFFRKETNRILGSDTYQDINSSLSGY